MKSDLPQSAYEAHYQGETITDSRLEKIIDFFGSENQSKLAMEECAELIQAISKVLRYGATLETETSLIEEIADVEIMISQLKMIYFIRECQIEDVKEQKLERTIKRMERVAKI